MAKYNFADSAAAKVELERVMREGPSPQPTDVGYPFTEHKIDLSLISSTQPYVLDSVGSALLFRRGRSVPGARLDMMGLTRTGPGDRIYAPYRKVLVYRSLSSARVGFAYLESVARSDVFLVESSVQAGAGPDATTLWGTLTPTAGPTFVTLATSPPAPDAGEGFEIAGWSRLRILVDTKNDGVNQCTSFDLVPYVMRTWSVTNNQWLEQGTMRVTVPDSGPTGQRYRDVMLDLGPAQEEAYYPGGGESAYLQEYMILVAQNVVGGGTLGAVVQGIS